MRLEAVFVVLGLTLIGTGCNSNYWTENSTILTDTLTLDPGDSQRVEGTIRVGGDLGSAEVDFCALVVSALYEPTDPTSRPLRIQRANEEPEVLPPAARYRFDDHLELERYDDPALQFTRAGEECAFSLGFSNQGDERLELALILFGRVGGAEKTNDGVEVPPAPQVDLQYDVQPE